MYLNWMVIKAQNDQESALHVTYWDYVLIICIKRVAL